MKVTIKRLISGIVCTAMTFALASCGGGETEQQNNNNIAAISRISPDTLITVETAASIANNTMRMSDEGIVDDGKTLTVTYVSEPIGQGDSVSVSIEQFSDTLSTSDVWNDYEYNRITRSDQINVDGIGSACYIAFPYINVYTRGCYIRISAGSGNDENQKNTLINLAAAAAVAVENAIPSEAVGNSSDNVIR